MEKTHHFILKIPKDQSFMMTKNQKVEIFGATSLIAPYLLKRLAAGGFSGRCWSRNPQPEGFEPETFQWGVLDVLNPGGWNPEPEAILISLMPIWLLPNLVSQSEGLHQVIAFSSTSVFSKTISQDPKEKNLAAMLAEGEEGLIKTCRNMNISWTILRPTLIYDPWKDENISAIGRFIKKWHFFPLAYPARGLRQPIHADDLAVAAVAAMNNRDAFDTDFNLTGGETLSYLEMVKRVFEGLGKAKFIIPLPIFFLKVGLAFLNRMTREEYSPELFTRMNQDLVFDAKPAQASLNYQPRPFHPEFKA